MHGVEMNRPDHRPECTDIFPHPAETDVRPVISQIFRRVTPGFAPGGRGSPLVWVELGSKPLANMHPMTVQVLRQLEIRLTLGPLRHDAPIPFFHFFGGKMQMEMLPGKV